MSIESDPKEEILKGYAEAKKNAEKDPTRNNLAILAMFTALVAAAFGAALS
jgi:glucose-6-phosphate isomerase